MSKGLSCGIVGLPNVGKSTLFNALTKQQIEASNYPFCTIDPNVGVVEVPDDRIKELAKIFKSAKHIYATTSFVDIAGLVAGASKGEGLGNQFLANIRETDLIIQVVRCFDDDNIVHVDGKIDPLSDITTINIELTLADLQMCENVMVKLKKQLRTQKDGQSRLEALEKVYQHLNNDHPVRTLELSDDEQEALKPYNFLTAKPKIYLCNVDESSLPSMENPYVAKVREIAEKENCDLLTVCAKLEEEIAALSDEDAEEYLQEMGLKESGLKRLIRHAFNKLGLITFLTAGEVEARAWTIHQGTKAPEAAGEIHTDIARGFIRAEVIPFDDLQKHGSKTKAKESGLARMEGKDYIVHDGDVITFFHN